MMLYAGVANASAADRCAAKHCTCFVVPERSQYKSNASHRRDYISIYFEEDIYALNKEQIALIKEFVSRGIAYEVVAYTDGCADYQHNIGLAKNRLRSVQRQIGKVSYQTIVPEESAYHSPRSRRVDIYRITDTSIAGAISRVKADVYLLDASGSMAGAKAWRDIISASFKPSSKVYVSKMSDCYNGQRLNSVPYGGGTEIWYSYWWVLKRMKPGQSILVVSDFNSNYALTPSESSLLESLAKEKNITVYSIKIK